MTKSQKYFLGVVGSVLTVILAVNFVLPMKYFPSWALSDALFIANPVRRVQVRLLCNTDHQALLEACRKLSRRTSQGTLKPRTYWVRVHRAPEVSQFPQPILDLVPDYVRIEEDGRVTVGMRGGMNSLGMVAYPEKFKGLDPTLKYGDREIISGLWYYDEEYNYNPKYDKEIETLLQKRKK